MSNKVTRISATAESVRIVRCKWHSQWITKSVFRYIV